MIEQYTVAHASPVEPPEAAAAAITAPAAAPGAAAAQEIGFLELLTEPARGKAPIARITLAAMAIGIALSVIK